MNYNALYNLAFNQISPDEAGTPAVVVCRVLDKVNYQHEPANQLENLIMDKIKRFEKAKLNYQFTYDELIQAVKDFQNLN